MDHISEAHDCIKNNLNELDTERNNLLPEENFFFVVVAKLHPTLFVLIGIFTRWKKAIFFWKLLSPSREKAIGLFIVLFKRKERLSQQGLNDLFVYIWVNLSEQSSLENVLIKTAGVVLPVWMGKKASSLHFPAK